MRPQSPWTEPAVPAYPPLSQDLLVDVCVVGAGIAGLTTAYLLTKAGKRVAVLDDGPVGGGMTAMTSAHLAWSLDDRYAELARIRGDEVARLAGEAHRAAIAAIERISAQEAIDCDFARVKGYLFLADGDKASVLDEELEATRRLAFPGVTAMEEGPFGTFDTGPCLVWPDHARFHPIKYLRGLAEAIRRGGGQLFGASHVDSIEGGAPVRVFARGRGVTAQAVVVATNVPVNDRLVIHTKQAPYMTYVIGARVPRGSVPDVLAWDSGDPYHYIRIAPHGEDDLLIVGGEDHKSGQAADTKARHERLILWTRERFPMAGEIEYAWSGQVMETMDGLSFTGANPLERNVYVHTGDSGMGLTHGTIAGLLISDLVQGRPNRWKEVFDPSRKPLKAAGAFVSENINVARQYADWLKDSDMQAVNTIPTGTGVVMQNGLGKLAVYRDEAGEVHACSAKCPHLGCIVHWNDAAKTWDCPCHGSRFDPHGHVINGPANRDLDPAAQPPQEKAA